MWLPFIQKFMLIAFHQSILNAIFQIQKQPTTIPVICQDKNAF